MKCETETETQRERQRWNDHTMLSCHFAWNKVWRLGSGRNLWRRWILNPFFPSMCFSLKRFLHKFMTAPCLCFPLHNPLWFWRPSRASLRTQCVLRDRWEEMIHSSDEAWDTRPSWPADLMVYIADLILQSPGTARVPGLRLLGLSVEHGVQVIMSPVVTLCDSKHKLASPAHSTDRVKRQTR